MAIPWPQECRPAISFPTHMAGDSRICIHNHSTNSRGPYTHYHLWGSGKPPNNCLLPSQVLLGWAWWFPGPASQQLDNALCCGGGGRAIIIMTVKTIQLFCRDTKPIPYSSICSFLGPISYPWFFSSCYQFSIIPLLTFRMQQHLHFKLNRKLPGHVKATQYSLSQQSGYSAYQKKIMKCSAISGLRDFDLFGKHSLSYYYVHGMAETGKWWHIRP